MQTKSSPLLCELHAHSTWSDGALSLRQLADLYGRSGFDVLAVTDHAPRDPQQGIQAWNHQAYLAAIDDEIERAHRLYGLLIIPGLELTYDDEHPARAAHAVAVGLRSYVAVAEGIETMLRAARAHGAALVAAHPYPLEAAGATRATAAFASEPERWSSHVDRYELFNRHTLFSWVADAGLPVVANGDFHRVEHLHTWKTMLPCAKDEEAVVEYLRSARPTYLVQLRPERHLRAA
ncbi:MAG TPA: PHP domain-containing protein [Gaiellaceae bacterium]|nr:PHP domain-containing protein [Gaiellaceae bacterium]